MRAWSPNTSHFSSGTTLAISDEDVGNHMGTTGAQYMSYDRYSKTALPTLLARPAFRQRGDPCPVHMRAEHCVSWALGTDRSCPCCVKGGEPVSLAKWPFSRLRLREASICYSRLRSRARMT
jgi:hypothetical protein